MVHMRFSSNYSETITREARLVTSEQLKKAMEKAKMSVEDLAEMIGRDKRTIYRWLSGETAVPKFVSLLFK